MITRDLTDNGYAACAPGNPPPLHVRDTQSLAANWHPYKRPFLMPQHPGPVLVEIPGLPGDQVGEDPTDVGRQHRPRMATPGLIDRLNIHPGKRNVAARGERH